MNPHSCLIEWRQVRALAGKEFSDRLRNRWVLVVALVFTIASLLITYFGGAAQGRVGPSSIELTIASLVSLVIYLVPLIALLLGFDAIVGERERGSLDLLLALPITRLELLLGKYLGLALALSLSTLAGFALVGVLMGQQFGMAGLYHYIGFVISAWMLGLCFLSLAVCLSVLARDRTRASGLAIALWFSFVLVFDLLLLGVLVASGGQFGGDALPWLLHLVGDIHQPLHVGRHGDEGGNAVEIENPFNKRLPFSSLHLYWDDLPGPPWLRGKRLEDNARRLLERYPAPEQGNVARWREESHRLLDSAYPTEPGSLLPIVSEAFHRASRDTANRRIVDADRKSVV